MYYTKFSPQKIPHNSMGQFASDSRLISRVLLYSTSMIVYLDNSFLNRPFDDPESGVNKLEAEVLLSIIKLARNGKIILVNSSVIEYENSVNPFPDRKIFVHEILKQCTIYQNIDLQIKNRAKVITKNMGVSPIDALHLAAAEKAKVDLFITCDYNLIKKYKGNTKIITPLEFFSLYEHTNQ